MEKTKVNKLREMMKAKAEIEAKKQSPPKAETISAVDKDQQPAEVTEQASAQVNVDEMTAQIKAAEDEAKAHYDKLLRVMAEFENFKKRIERERMEQAKYANQNLLHDLLPVLDDFDRVIDHIPEEATTEVSAIAYGVRLIQNHFINAISRHGLEPLESSIGKPFDPNIHEAVAHIESDCQEGTIIAEHRKGWKLHDRVIRAATVSVAKTPVKNEA